MQPRGPLVLLATILSLTLAAIVLVVVNSLDRDSPGARAREYQELVGGLGFGSAVDLSRCASSFDPRLGQRCPGDFGPLPGGGYFCPHHAFSILYYRALDGVP
jgi:hypothetical protein